MKKLYLATIFVLMVFPSGAYSQVYKSFKNRYTFGKSLDFLGVGPYGSANIEWIVLKSRKSFINIQAGIGIISLPSNIWSSPQVITYNYWINQRINNRRKDCNPERKDAKAEYFIELGIGNLIIAGDFDIHQVDYLFPVSGLRVHFPLSRKSVIFTKLRFIPYTRYNRQTKFGIALGVSI